MVWVKSSIRRCYQERTNDVRYAVITVQYFSLALPFLISVIFLIGASLGCGSPTTSVSRLGHIPAARKARTLGDSEIAPMSPSGLSANRGNNQWLFLEVAPEKLDRAMLKTIA
jgi:hypothetical protein